MKIRVFQSDKGDCLLLTSNDGKHILADGGMVGSYKKHVSPFMGDMRQNGEEIDLVYVSHIDQDHISGILRMMDDEMAWKIHDFQTANGNPGHKEPKSHRPPEVKAIWHNSFHEQVGKNSGPIEDMLAATAAALSTRSDDGIADVVKKQINLTTSKREAALLSRRIGAKQLNIPLNPEFDGGLMFIVPPPDVIDIGSMRITVVGPFDEELAELREEWNEWLESTFGKKQVAKIKKDSTEDEHLIGNGEIDALLAPIFAFADELGDRNNVTQPNLASLMLLIEEDGSTVLMTGDGHCDDLTDGLDALGRLRPDGSLHVDVLKMLHHGSEHNWHPKFGSKVTADHYVFCGNGSHHNPDLGVVKGVIASRLGPPGVRSENPEVGNEFKLWFNSSDQVTKPQHKPHMKELRETVEAAAADSSGQMKQFFLQAGDSFDFDL